MSECAIRVEGLSKAYRIGLRESMNTTLAQTLTSWIRAPARNWRRLRRLTSFKDAETAEDVLWALRDVSFEVPEGEVLGIVGRNGAGKTTLLKVLSRITEPTSGRVTIHGRVASLLEVGTGFHPELTGRENVYMNGTILGMTRCEVDRRFDEIVAFSEVEKFIDTPVKRYSSGMRVRLAFAVAAHLEPEILVIDEVLAVGDASFQSRCLGKMGEAASGGRTVLFVSHNMAAVSALCTSCILVDEGRLVQQGDVQSVVGRYLGRAATAQLDVDLSSHEGRRRGLDAVLRRFRITATDGSPLDHVVLGQDLAFRIRVASKRRRSELHLGIRIISPRGERVMTPHTRFQVGSGFELEGEAEFVCVLPSLRLLPGFYRVELDLKSGPDSVDYIESGLGLEILGADLYGTGRLPPPRTGVLAPDAAWSFVPGARDAE